MAAIEFESLATLPDYVHPDDEFGVDIDISSWLGTDTISSVAYTAVDDSQVDATSDVLITGQCSETSTIITCYIKGNTHDTWYIVKMVVTTAGGDEKTFYLKFYCYDYNYSI